MEPTLRNALRRLSADSGQYRSTSQPRWSVAEGMRLIRRGNEVDVTVDITIDGRSALDTASDLRQRLCDLIEDQGLQTARVSVVVLAVR